MASRVSLVWQFSSILSSRVPRIYRWPSVQIYKSGIDTIAIEMKVVSIDASNRSLSQVLLSVA